MAGFPEVRFWMKGSQASVITPTGQADILPTKILPATGISGAN